MGIYKYVNGKKAITDEIIAFSPQTCKPFVLRTASINSIDLITAHLHVSAFSN